MYKHSVPARTHGDDPCVSLHSSAIFTKVLEHFPYYCEPDEFYECRFYWEKTAYRSLLSVYTYRENALAAIVVMMIMTVVVVMPMSNSDNNLSTRWNCQRCKEKQKQQTERNFFHT